MTRTAFATPPSAEPIVGDTATVAAPLNSKATRSGSDLPKIVVEPSHGPGGLGVQLLKNVHGPHGIEFFAGEGYGFSVESAVSLVANGVGKARVFGPEDFAAWGKALEPFEELLREKYPRATDLVHFVDSKQRELVTAMEEKLATAKPGEEVTFTIDRANTKLVEPDSDEGKKVADALAAEAEKAKLNKAVTEGAAADAGSAAGPAAATAPVAATETVSNPDVGADEVAKQAEEPKPTPPPPAKPSKRR